MSNLQQNIKAILYSTQYCGLCLNNDENMSTFNENFEILVNGQTHKKTLRDIIEFVFTHIDNVVTNSQICNTCTGKLLKSYIFIQTSVETSKNIANYIHDMLSKANDIQTLLNESNIDSSTVAIVLENRLIDDDHKENDDHMDIREENEMKREGEKKREKEKCSIFKSSSPNVTLPSNTLEKEHKIAHLSCKICSKNFKTEKYLKAHYRVHCKVKCKICHEIFPDGEILEHLKMNHKDTIHMCTLCNLPFYSLNSLQAHNNICHVPLKEEATQCVMCLKAFSEDELNDHKCKFNCPECNQMPCIHYKYLMYYREQILNHCIRAKCLDCDYVCRKREILLGHVNREHLNHYPYTCEKCGQKFYSKLLLKAHIHRFHQDIYICNYCDKEFNSLTICQSHKESCEGINRDFACDDCTTSFNTVEELVDHKRRRHSKDIFPCGLCNKKFLKDSKRKEHMVKVHSGLQIRNRSINVECVVCLEKFHTKGDLIEHMKTHGPNTTYPCRKCNIEYETLRKFRAHNRKHVGPFAICEVCGKEMRKVLLEKHMSTHTDAIMTCGTCGKSFQNITLLKYHQKIHLESIPCPKCKKHINSARLRRHYKGHVMDESPESKDTRKQRPNLKCEQCNYKTWNNILLECHMNRHHLKIKPYVCHVCSKDFIGRHLLKKHLEAHTIEKSVVCMICFKSFANSVCLKMHLRLHTGERPFTCEICGNSFRTSSIMNVHKLKKHSEKNYSCPLCSNKFHTIGDLRRHVIKVHWKQKRRFDPRELKGLGKEHYHLFHDGRRIKVAEGDVDFYMPC